MRIAFKFKYTHNNGLFVRILERIAQRSALPLSLYHEGTEYRVEATGEQPELESVADEISALVPKSLFLAEYAIEEVKEEKSEGSELLAEEHAAYQIPYCPECQEKIIETSDPFVECTVCGFSDISLDMDDLASYTGVNSESREEFFGVLADQLLEKGELSLPTYNGIRRFSLLTSGGDKNDGILFCDPTDISEKFLITQGELDALMTVEKPTVRLKAKFKFRMEHELNEPFYPVFFADDKVTLALSTALKEKGIEAVFSDSVTTLRVSSALEQQLIITVGRDILPWHFDLTLKSAAFCEYGGFQAYGDSEGLILDHQINIEGRSFIAYIANNTKKYQNSNTPMKNTIGFEPAHAALRSIVLEKGLEEKGLCGVYLSRNHTSHIFSFAPKIGYTPMVLITDEYLFQPREMIEAIASMDEGGMRLVSNFKQQFPELYAKAETLTFEANDDLSPVTRLWAMAAVFIGLYEESDILKACEMLESTAIEFGGKSGPRIDYKVISTGEGYQLDMRLAIRSAMSFKLAGLDDYLLSFGFIDSLADFIAQQAEDSDANIGIEGVTLSGSLFENRQLFMRTYNALSANYPIYRNERLSIDDANVTVGALTLGNE